MLGRWQLMAEDMGPLRSQPFRGPACRPATETVTLWWLGRKSTMAIKTRRWLGWGSASAEVMEHLMRLVRNPQVQAISET